MMAPSPQRRRGDAHRAGLRFWQVDEEAARALRLLLKKGVLGAGVFQVDDCRKTYEELKARGVQFKGAPEERFYGIEAIMTDGLGNWFSMTQPKPWKA